MAERLEANPLQIPVEHFIEKYEVTNPATREVLYAFPALSYLLGNSRMRRVTDSRDASTKRKHILWSVNGGSGMFGLKTPEEALDWRGIANHIFGSVRHIKFLSELISQASEEQKAQLTQFGFNRTSIDAVDPALLESFQFISHAGRRKADEHAWYGVHLSPAKDYHDEDKPHHSYLYTMETLKSEGAPTPLLDLMRVEDHYYEVRAMRPGLNPDIVDNILTYGDWTYNQKPVTLAERFEGLRKNGRQSPEILDILQTAGTAFENALKETFGADVFDRMANLPPFPGELEIRTAYAISSGLTLRQIYPDFA